MLKHFARTLVTCAVAYAAAGAATGAAGDIAWQTNLRTASAAARAVNKPMLIEFWAVWCPPCKVMDEQVYPNAAVKEAMSKVMPVRIDVDKQESVARQYDIASMPTLIVADSYGTELFRFTGNVSAETMTELLKELPADITNINRLTQIVARDKDNAAALESLGRELKAAKLFRASNQYFERAMRVRARAGQESRRGEILIAMGQNQHELKQFREAGESFERYLREFSGGPGEPDAMLGLARALVFQNKRADARRTLQMLTARYKTGPAHDQAVRLLGTL
jgi:thioredoxin-like negative regulator of GroEL